MKKNMLAFCLTVSVMGAGLLPQGERDRAMSSLHASRKIFLDETVNLSEAQWTFKPGPDRWSIAECAEHIALSEDTLFQRVTEKIMKSPAEPDKSTAQQKAKDQSVLEMIPNRSRKAQAPEFLQPSGKWKNREDLVNHFKESRDRTIAYVEKGDESMREHFAAHPAMETLDAYQWILLMSAHSERHVAQIREVKADASFPKQ